MQTAEWVVTSVNAAQIFTTAIAALAAFLLKDLHSRISRFMDDMRKEMTAFSVRMGKIETRLGMESGEVKATEAQYPFSHNRSSKRRR